MILTLMYVLNHLIMIIFRATNMDETEIKILKAALAVFAEYGYNGATTNKIARKAGFSELTLFRKFKTKENLFNTVLNYNTHKFKDEYHTILDGKKYDSSYEFFRNTMLNMAQFADNNIEFIRLMVFEKKIQEPVMGEFIHKIGGYLQDNLVSSDINFPAFSILMTSSLIILGNEKYLGRSFADEDDTLDDLIHELSLLI
jgi:TetR/AcrR family transcriptional regulator